MTAVHNRLSGSRREVGTYSLTAVSTERVKVILGDSALRDQRHNIDIVLPQPHDKGFMAWGLTDSRWWLTVRGLQPDPPEQMVIRRIKRPREKGRTLRQMRNGSLRHFVNVADILEAA